MLSLHLMSQRLPSALTLVVLGAPLIGCGVSAAAEEISQKMVQLDTRSNLAVKPMLYRNPHRNPKKQLAAVIAAVAGVLLLAGLDIGVKAILLYVVLFGIVLILLAAVDIKTGYLPDMLTMPLMVAGLVVNYWHFFASFTNACLGTAMGFFVIAVSNVLHQRFRRQAGFGGGDAKMLAAIGAWVGLQGVLLTSAVAVFLASISLFATEFKPRDGGHSRGTHHRSQAFGPYLSAAGITAILVSSNLHLI